MSIESPDASVTQYLAQFKEGCENATNELVERYWPRVIAAASSQLNSEGIRIADEEDVAVSVFGYFCQEAGERRFDSEDLKDRNDLWRHLSKLIKHKAIDVARKEKAAKRGSGKVFNEAKLGGEDSNSGLGELAGVSTTPVQQAIEIEERTNFLNSLQTDDIREVVMLRLEGYQQNEIAEKVGLSVRTVRRKLELAKQTWDDQLANP